MQYVHVAETCWDNSNVAATFSTMEQTTKQQQNEQQARQDTPLEGPSNKATVWISLF